MRALVVAGLGFGDEGKGSLVDFLVRHEGAKTVVRFNGGAQAAHNVVTPEGQHHTFSQFGSGTFAGAETLLSRFMLVNPTALKSEEAHLQSVGVTDAYDRLLLEGDALVTTPFHVSMNRVRELVRGKGRHGSCGMGIGETIADAQAAPEDALRVRDLLDHDVTLRKLWKAKKRKQREVAALVTSEPEGQLQIETDVIWDNRNLDDMMETYLDFAKRARIVDNTYLADLLKEPGSIVFEGAQGVLLDQAWGLFPHVTRSDTTFTNALRLLNGHGDVLRIGAFRSYFTRHGAGPFPTEDRALEFPDHNCWGPWQQNFRWGHFDLVLARYALTVTEGADILAFTCLDHVPEPTVCNSYEGQGPLAWLQAWRELRALHASPQTPEHLGRQAEFTRTFEGVRPVYKQMRVEEIAQKLGVPIGIRSRGLTAKDKEW